VSYWRQTLCVHSTAAGSHTESDIYALKRISTQRYQQPVRNISAKAARKQRRGLTWDLDILQRVKRWLAHSNQRQSTSFHEMWFQKQLERMKTPPALMLSGLADTFQKLLDSKLPSVVFRRPNYCARSAVQSVIVRQCDISGSERHWGNFEL
jgi:hypothetical protein